VPIIQAKDDIIDNENWRLSNKIDIYTKINVKYANNISVKVVRYFNFNKIY